MIIAIAGGNNEVRDKIYEFIDNSFKIDKTYSITDHIFETIFNLFPQIVGDEYVNYKDIVPKNIKKIKFENFYIEVGTTAIKYFQNTDKIKYDNRYVCLEKLVGGIDSFVYDKVNMGLWQNSFIRKFVKDYFEGDYEDALYIIKDIKTPEELDFVKAHDGIVLYGMTETKPKLNRIIPGMHNTDMLLDVEGRTGLDFRELVLQYIRVKRPDCLRFLK